MWNWKTQKTGNQCEIIKTKQIRVAYLHHANSDVDNSLAHSYWLNQNLMREA
jgi:hypothetical protein